MAEAADALTADELALIADDGGKKGDEVTTPEWAEAIKDDGLKTAVSGYESEADFLTALGLEIKTDGAWTDGLPDDLKEVAEKFSSKDDAVRAIVAFRKRDSQIRLPGKDATDDERTAYAKAIGVPKSVDGYEFPDIPKEELTDAITASRKAWAERFHKLQVSKETAKALTLAAQEEAIAVNAAEKEADKTFAAAQEEALREEWKGEDYEKNVTHANRALTELSERSGVKVDDLKHIQTKDGRFLLDRGDMLKVFAAVGREMAEGLLGPTLTDSQKETIGEEIIAKRVAIEKAQTEGNSKLANKLYQEVLALTAKQKGTAPIVGSEGRTA